MSDLKNRTLPEDVAPYARSPHFTSENLPDKLRNSHDLKAGTWGRLNVLSGKVAYFLTDYPVPHHLHTGETFVIPPQEKHYIDISQDAELFIEFCARPKASRSPSSPPCSAHESDMNHNGYMDWTKVHNPD